MQQTVDYQELLSAYERDKAIHDCENVIGKIFYYNATYMTDEIVQLWADRDDSTLELPFGRYDGIKSVRRYYETVMNDRSAEGMMERLKGVMCVSMLENQILEVAGDRKTARGVWMSPGMETYGRAASNPEFVGKGLWSWCKVAADFILEDGVWKVWHLVYLQLFRTDYHESWTKTGEYQGFVMGEANPDRPPRWQYTKYDPEAILPAWPEAPKAYHSFAEVAPGYGYDVEEGKR